MIGTKEQIQEPNMEQFYFHMEYPKTALINTAAIINAIKNQPNHYKIQTQKTNIVDVDASNCYACPYYNRGENCTRSCGQKRFQVLTQRIYVNERNHFGTRQKLNTLAIKLFLYLHFLRVDKYGYARIEVTEAAEQLSCSKKSVTRNLETLSKRGYISYGKGLYPGTYQVFILSIKDNQKSASEGGRGYFVLSFDMLKTLINCKTINVLRLQLRGIVSTLDGLQNNQFLNETSFADTKRMLPDYVTKKQIIQIITTPEFGTMFGVKLSKGNRFFYLTMKDRFNPVRLKSEICDHCRDTITDAIKTLNDSISKTNKKQKKQDPLLQVKLQDLNDISKIALQLPETVIVSAVCRLYELYVKKGERIHSIGAMVRTLAWDIYGYQLLAG